MKVAGSANSVHQIKIMMNMNIKVIQKKVKEN